MKHNELEKMIDKYVPMILTLSEMDSDTAEMKAGFIFEYSCAMKSHFRKSGNQMTGRRKSSNARLLAQCFI